eukprot:TRINITY_DN6191_c1_g1_i1.p1 TRINITY_DN6191_c1_g1~~TRINITY_DN6191_c1_g1_i1.p1  ORF type:complete len:603 (+),score=73.71 TRINITY_DN6191_c1_g1_i1:751-2559(+)
MSLSQNGIEELASLIFRYFDKDGDGFWCWAEVANAVLVTEGREVAYEEFVDMCNDESRGLSEEEVKAQYRSDPDALVKDAIAVREVEGNQDELVSFYSCMSTNLLSPLRTKQGFLGIEIAESPTGGGVLVSSVAPCSPASQKDIRPNDLITQMNGITPSHPKDFVKVASALNPGDGVGIVIKREHEVSHKELTAGKKHASSPSKEPVRSSLVEGLKRLEALRYSGDITESEFRLAKVSLLGISASPTPPPRPPIATPSVEVRPAVEAAPYVVSTPTMVEATPTVVSTPTMVEVTPTAVSTLTMVEAAPTVVPTPTVAPTATPASVQVTISEPLASLPHTPAMAPMSVFVPPVTFAPPVTPVSVSQTRNFRAGSLSTPCHPSPESFMVAPYPPKNRQLPFTPSDLQPPPPEDIVVPVKGDQPYETRWHSKSAMSTHADQNRGVSLPVEEVACKVREVVAEELQRAGSMSPTQVVNHYHVSIESPRKPEPLMPAEQILTPILTNILWRGTHDPIPAYRYRNRLINLYERYRPDKLPSVVPTLRQYKSREEEVFSILVEKYGPEPTTDILCTPLPPNWIQSESPTGDIFYTHRFSGEKKWPRPRM